VIRGLLEKLPDTGAVTIAETEESHLGYGLGFLMVCSRVLPKLLNPLYLWAKVI